MGCAVIGAKGWKIRRLDDFVGKFERRFNDFYSLNGGISSVSIIIVIPTLRISIYKPCLDPLERPMGEFSLLGAATMTRSF